MSMSVDTVISLNRTAYQSLKQAASVLGDQISWCPLKKGRSALNQLAECAGFANLTAIILQTQQMPTLDMAEVRRQRAELDTAEKAFAALDSGMEKMAIAIESFPGSKWEETVILPFGAGIEKSFAELPLMVYWNAVYHEGQINLLQQMVEWDLPNLESQLLVSESSPAA